MAGGDERSGASLTPDGPPVQPGQWDLDPAPYAWLDDRGRMAGSVPIAVNLVVGAILLAGAVAIVVLVFQRPAAPTAVRAGLFALLGGYLVRMGVKRRSWAHRHPGVDPASALPSWAPDGPVVASTVSGAAARWMLILVSTVLAPAGLALMVTVVTPPYGYPIWQLVAGFLLGAVFAVFFGLTAFSMWRVQRRPRPVDRAAGVSPSAFGGPGRLATTLRAVVLVLALTIGGFSTLTAVVEARDPPSSRLPW